MAITLATRQNAELLEDTYQRWLKDPDSVEPSLRAFCEGFHLGFAKFEDHAPGANGFAPAAPPATGDASLQTRVDGLVHAYRTLGHTLAWTNPLETQRPQNDLLGLRELGFAEK